MKKEENAVKRSYKERYDLTRHPERIRSSDVIKALFGNISYYDSPDPTLIVAKGTIDKIDCIILGQEKRKRGTESKATGMTLAKGYGYALDILEEAEKNKIPVVTFIDTFGGDSSMDSELGGQSFLISDCISKFCAIKTPTISYIIGEGGSGGALALQVTDRSYMLENSLYSVIAPESCSRIIFHKKLAQGVDIESTIGDALEVLRPGAEHIKDIGMIDEILPEPKEGAHTDYEFTVKTIEKSLIKTLNEWISHDKNKKKTVKAKIINKLVKERREKVLNYGKFYDTLSRLEKRKTKRIVHDDLNRVRIERDDFHTMFLIKATMEKKGIEEDELFNCEKEWDKEKKVFKVAGGCGFISLNEYKENYYACPKCGKGEYLGVEEQIEKICDNDTFLGIECDLTIKKLIGRDKYNFGKYKDLLKRLEGTTFSKEALVTGTAKLNGRDVVVAISDLKFIGGSFGAVVGEKFKRAVDYAVKNHYPFISVCSSGGARMNEGPMALAQMAKMNMSLLDLKNEGVLYLSVITVPTTGGAYASYVTQGDIIIGEKGSLVEFAGPRVVLGAGLDVDREIVTTDNLYKTNKIQHLVDRKCLKKTLSFYVDFFYDIKFPNTRKGIGRIKDFRKLPCLPE